MKKNLSDYMVALAVIACSLVLLGALTVALSGFKLKKPTRTLQIDYVDVTGIHLASELRYAGAQAGHVIGIRLLSADERKADLANPKMKKANAVRITVEVDNDVPPIPEDAYASINSDTLLSEKFISLSAGTPIGTVPEDKNSEQAGGPMQELANNAILQGHPNGLDVLMNGGGDLMNQINGLLADAKGDLNEVVPKLSAVIDSAKNLIDAAEPLVGNNSSLRVALDEAKDAVAKLEGIEGDLDGVLNKAGGLLTDVHVNVDDRMKELSVVLENLKVTTTYLKSFSKQVAEKPNRVIFTTKSEKQPDEQDILKSQKPVPAPQ